MAEKVSVKGVEYVRLFAGDDDNSKFLGFCQDVAAHEVEGGADFSGVNVWISSEVAAKPVAFRRVIHLFVDMARSKSVAEAVVLVDGLLWGLAPGNEKLKVEEVLGFRNVDELRESVLFCHRLAVELEYVISPKQQKRSRRGSSDADSADSGVEKSAVDTEKKSSSTGSEKSSEKVVEEKQPVKDSSVSSSTKSDEKAAVKSDEKAVVK